MGRNFKKRYKEHFYSFKYNNYNSKYMQHILETGHMFRKMKDIMSIKHYDKRGKHLDTMERFFIYPETKNNNQLNDKHTFVHIKIFIQHTSITVKYNLYYTSLFTVKYPIITSNMPLSFYRTNIHTK
jgi:hypothetical protein